MATVDFVVFAFQVFAEMFVSVIGRFQNPEAEVSVAFKYIGIRLALVFAKEQIARRTRVLATTIRAYSVGIFFKGICVAERTQSSRIELVDTPVADIENLFSSHVLDMTHFLDLLTANAVVKCVANISIVRNPFCTHFYPIMLFVAIRAHRVNESITHTVCIARKSALIIMGPQYVALITYIAVVIGIFTPAVISKLRPDSIPHK